MDIKYAYIGTNVMTKGGTKGKIRKMYMAENGINRVWTSIITEDGGSIEYPLDMIVSLDYNNENERTTIPGACRQGAGSPEELLQVFTNQPTGARTLVNKSEGIRKAAGRGAKEPMKKTLKDIALFIGAILMIGAVVASGVMKFLADWDHKAGICDNLVIAMWTVPIFLFGIFLVWLGGGNEIDG